jgi:hypothetical protein
MGRKRDQFWDHVEDLNGRFKCNYCERYYPGGASRIKSHLAGIQGRDIVICQSVPKDVQEKACQEIKGANKKQKRASTSSSAKGIEITSNSISKVDTLHRVFEKVSDDVMNDVNLSLLDFISRHIIGCDDYFNK